MSTVRRCILGALCLFFALQSSPAQNEWGLNFKGGLAIPVGSFDEHFNTGFGGTATLLYAWSDWFDFFVGTGISAWKVDDDAVTNTLRSQGVTGRVDLDAPFTIIPLVAGVRYNPPGQRILPYGSLSIGVYFMDLIVRGTYTEGGTIVPIEERSDSFTELTLAIEAGVLIPVATNLQLDAGVRFNNIPDYESVILIGTPSGQNPVRAKNLLFVTIAAGLEYSF